MSKGKRKPRDIAEIRRIVAEAFPGCCTMEPRERDLLLADAVSKALGEHVTPKYLAPFIRWVEAEALAAAADRPQFDLDNAHDFIVKSIDRYIVFLDERMRSFSRPELFGAQVGAIKTLIELLEKRAKWSGVVPPVEDEKSGDVHLHLHFDPDPEPAVGD